MQQNGNHGAVVALRDVTERVREEDRLRYFEHARRALTEFYNRAFFEAEKSRLESGRVAPISASSSTSTTLKVVTPPLRTWR
ncbi:MAG: hypothetical protein R3B99_07735 [Polyangiales bacterium]